MAETKKHSSAANVLSGTEGVKEVTRGIQFLPGQGNCLSVDIGDGIVLEAAVGSELERVDRWNGRSDTDIG